MNSLLQRRDHLLAVNARLAIPLTSQPSTHSGNLKNYKCNILSSLRLNITATNDEFGIPVNNIHPSINPSHPSISHPEGAQGLATISRVVNRDTRVNNTYLPHSSSGGHATPMENGLPPDPSPPAAASLSQYQQHRGSMVGPQQSPTIR